MENLEAHKLIKSRFQELETVDSLEKLDKSINDKGLKERISSFYEKYPNFDFNLTREDIDQLKKSELITADHKLDPEKFSKDPLTKLLAAVLWKNGDIHKVQHLIDGITGREGDRTSYSLVFKQYGASLADHQQPIVDQHVLRAFELFKLQEFSEAAVAKLRKKELYKSADKKVLDSYRTWFQNMIKRVPPHEQTEFREKLDKVLFIFGKDVKLKV
ncbi:hypothetical protein [Algoriphagus terrigena]|uniref:hypothetical protein n=1 Tax=Algoriphagus terrigena TaxID=344884 RepID=UPI0004097335|nr:hypothetical protein [Algoriphagus terrigena]